MKVRRSRLAVLAATALTVLAGGLGIATAQAADPGVPVDYKVTNQWAGGFGADVTVTNLGDAVTGWTLGWTLAAGQGVTQAGTPPSRSAGTAVTATNVSYNGAVGPGAVRQLRLQRHPDRQQPGAGVVHVQRHHLYRLTGSDHHRAVADAVHRPEHARHTTPCTGTDHAADHPAHVAGTRAGQGLDGRRLHHGTPSACPVGWGSQFAPVLQQRRHRAEQRRRRAQHPDLAVRGQRHLHQELGRRVRAQLDRLQRAVDGDARTPPPG